MAKTEPLTHEEIVAALHNLGVDSGWVVTGDEITLWEHSNPQPTEAELRAAL